MNPTDKNSSLSQIASQRGRSITSLLVDIQDSPTTTQERAISFIENLECLRLPRYPREDGSSSKVHVRREIIDGLQYSNYVALSYTWKASENKEGPSGSYRVQKRQSKEFEDSRPRDSPLDRIFHYMRAIRVEHLWVDQHSIVQGEDTPDCNDPTCEHDLCVKRRHGMAVMDRVYSLSDHPVGLLGRPITLAWEMKMLANLLQGKFTAGKWQGVKLSRKRNLREAWVAVRLLRRITNDFWWTRGWVFQENHRGGIKMKLLIRYSDHLERLKRRYEGVRSPYGSPIFGDVKGELCIRSVDFFEQATRLCLAFRKRLATYRNPRRKRMEILERILHRAGKYSLILGPSEPMTPQIIADLDEKDLGEPWDMLSITANCCGYSVRLNQEQLRDQGASLSLSILAQCLLNGEVLHNGRPHDHSIRDMKVSKYIKHALFSEFESPDSTHSHTFNKSCRFINPRLSPSGIHTRGHLWKLGKVINTSNWPSRGAWVNPLKGGLKGTRRKQLAYLARWLKAEGHRDLSAKIWDYLDRDAQLSGVHGKELNFVERYMRSMGEAVADAIESGRELILGSLWDADDGYSPYMGVFVWESRDGSQAEIRGSFENRFRVDGMFAFTASRPEDTSSDEFDLNDLDRHVSFQVQVEGGNAEGVPSLRIKRWLSGLCFFAGVSRSDVVFPWPRDLADITP
ncbi:hypothetical protein B0T16DRAFT_331333 [Cercophora newfieldiana]|uniref:Heterokaryon incompatibility domain-containing protein n=1 Tax=Cercophora newfieldiana TaxID=92897 RepID=A0AA39XZY7_9PEZI|nr:hypothetical protein B0T16DRAFT_331333 [Cercophora newfieldiana]